MGSPILPFTVDGRLSGARLCGFQTGSAVLLNAHKDWIVKYFVPKIKQYPNAWVDLIGNASMVGNAASNVALSKRRIDAVEQFIKQQYPGMRFNMRLPEGSTDAQDFQTDRSNDDPYWRAVLIRWYGVPLKIDTPVYPPEEPSTLKFRKLMAPKGCWCVVGVDTFGIPIKAGVTAGKADLTLLNDKGEQWLIKGLGLGGGVGVDVGPKSLEEGLKFLLANLMSIGLKAGDLTSVSKTIKDLNIIGPSDTGGGVFKRLTWSANLTITDITSSGYFTIANGAFHLLVAGGETGLIFFSPPPVKSLIPVVGPILNAADTVNSPWAFYGQAGLGTWKGAAEIGCTVYKITSKSQVAS